MEGKTLFIHWEQGLGDTIQFCRYASLLKARGADVIMSVQEPLVRLIGQMDPSVRIVGSSVEPMAFDYHCPMMSLPLALATTLETIPARPSYLAASQQSRSKWAERLPAGTRPRVGLVWRGSTTHPNDRNRSIDLGTLLPLLRDDVAWISLQQELTPDDAAMLRRDGRIAFFGDELADFDDTAGLAERLDLVISVDTAVAHLAGATGKPVWILLAFNSEWRWQSDRTDSPWYPSARLFRQRGIGTWSDVIRHVNRELDAIVNITE
jgi:hypothetical protein